MEHFLLGEGQWAEESGLCEEPVWFPGVITEHWWFGISGWNVFPHDSESVATNNLRIPPKLFLWCLGS